MPRRDQPPEPGREAGHGAGRDPGHGQRRDPFARIAAALHVAGADISTALTCDSPALDAPARPDALPRYPWQRQRFWYEPTDEATDTIATPREHPLLGYRRGEDPTVWFNTIDTANHPWLADHAVDGTPLLPATAMVEMALAAARARHPDTTSLDVLDLEITRPLLLERDTVRETRFSVTGDRGVFELASRPRLSGEPWTIHATGRIAAGSTAPMPLSRPIPAPTSTLSGAALHALTTRLGLDYGPAFQTVHHVDIQGPMAARVHLVPLSPDAIPALKTILDPTRTDGALQGLVALAAGHMGEGAALLPWRIGRVRLHSTPATITEARLRIDRVGPRSILAEILLLDPSGAVIASFADCWFTRIGAPAMETLSEATFHSVTIPSPRDPDTATAPTQAEPPVSAEPSAAPLPESEAALLTEAYIATIAYTAIAALSEHCPFHPATLVAAGQLHPAAQPLLHALLAWLERDDLATCIDGQWTLATDADLPPADEIWRSILDSAPTAVAEAALVGAMAEALPAMLAKGPAATPAGLNALTSHMIFGSPAAQAALDALARSVAEIAATWPETRPLRILELGATEGTVTARLVDALHRPGLAVRYTAAAARGIDLPSVTAAMARLPGATTIAWTLGEEPPGSLLALKFDLVIGALCLSRSGLDQHALGPVLATLQSLMAPGARLLLAEPRPNRVWDLRFGIDPAWWPNQTGSVGGGAPWHTTLNTSALRDGPAWQNLLHQAGFSDAASATVPGGIWDSNILATRAHANTMPTPAQPAHTPIDASLLIIAQPNDRLAQALAETMLAQGRRALLVPTDQAAETLRTAPPRDGDIVCIAPEHHDEPAMLAGLATTGAAIGAWMAALAETTGLRLWLATRDTDPHSGVQAAALRGILRVAANESPNLRPYFVAIAASLQPDAAAARLSAEIAAPDAEREVILGEHTRQVPRLRRGMNPAAPLDHAPARLVIGRPGLLDTLHWERAAPTAPGPNQVAIQVAASGLNFRDVMWALGLLPDEALLDGLAGATIGLECAGTVTAVGPNITSVQPGDRVMAIAPASLATHVLAPVQSVVRIPDTTDFASAATVPVAFLTVCYGLGTLANLQPGERVLIHGGAGGVGLAAIQYARHRGAEVFASAGSPAKRAVLRLLGVDHVLDSRSVAFADDVMALTANQGVDVVLNSLAGEAMERSVGILRPFGRFLELGKRDLYGNTPLGLRALRHNVSYFAIDADQLPVQRPDIARRVFAEIQSLMEQGVLRPLPHRIFGFNAATDAFRLMQSAGHIGKIVLTPDPQGLALPPPTADWQPDPVGTYLVTGGLSGFGLETARWLARHGARNLALLARRGPDTPGAAAAMTELAGQGVQARAIACDVSDPAALAAALATIRADMPPLVGIVHAAMVLDDALLPQLTPDRFQRVLAPKLQAALSLDRLTRADPISLFLLFSSITTTLGNPGQANYVAANAGMEALVGQRRAEGLPGMTVGWGPIADVGYLSREAAVSRALEQRMGGAHLRAAEALALLPALLGSSQPHVDVGHLRLAALRQHLPHLATPFFADVIEEGTTDENHVDLATLLLESTPEQGRALVGQILAEEVAAITKGSSQQIDLTRSLTDLGMDSLMAVELRMALERRLGGNLPLLSLADGSSIGAIAARIVRQLGAPDLQAAANNDAPPGPSPNPAISEAAAAMLAKYEDAPDASFILAETTAHE